MNIQWEKIRQSKSANPTPQFKEELRAALYENAVFEHQVRFEKICKKIEKPISSLELSFQKKSHPFQNFPDVFSEFSGILSGLRRWSFLLGGGALAMILVVPMLSIFVSAPLSASSKSYIYSFSGEGEIMRQQEKITPTSEQEIFEEDIFSTHKNSGAEILFFEGTSVRLDTNTSIKIIALSPEKGVFSGGDVQIQLITGRVWVQNFHSPTTQSALEIVTPNMNIFPIRAEMDIEYRGGKEHIRVFENSALIHIEGLSLESEVLLSPQQEIFFTPFDEKVEILSLSAKSSLWKIKNINRGNQYKRAYIQRISDKMKEEFVINEITSQIHTFIAQEPTPQEMEKMIEKINILMNASEQNFPKETTPDISETNDSENNNQEQDILTSLEKILVPATPVHKKLKNVSSQVYSYSSSASPITEKTKPKPKTEITPVLKGTLVTDQKILAELNSLPASEVEVELNPVYQEENNKNIKTAKQIVAEKQQEKLIKISQNFSDQINILSLRDSRRNHAQNILNKIPNTPENIALLEIMIEQAPTDVQRYIQAKKIKIERAIK